MMLDAINYKNGQKNHWRRTMWNHLADLTQDKREAVVLYLPGSTDLDRPEALRRGFKSWNLIAVERDVKVAKKLRSEGATVINDNLRMVMAGWPSDVPVAAVVADLQCGMCELANRILCTWVTTRAFSEGAIMINMMRGRDPGEAAEQTRDLTMRNGQRVIERMHLNGMIATPLSRAGLALSCVIGHSLSYTLDRLGIPDGDEIAEDAKLHINRTAVGAYKYTSLPSYRSSPGSPFFDSCIIRCVSRTFRQAPMKSHPAGRRIAAALAVRTMRKNGTLRTAERA